MADSPSIVGRAAEPADRPARMAYLIVSHMQPDQVVRLVRTLRRGSPGSHLVVHHDPRASGLDLGALASEGAVLVEPALPVRWGDYSHLAALLHCFGWMVRRLQFDWVTLLSGQDYPIRPLAAIERDLAGAEIDAFIEARPCPRPPMGRAPGQFETRYHLWWKRVPVDRDSRWAAWLGRAPGLRLRSAHGVSWLGRRRLRSPFGHGLACYVGADWFTLSSGAVQSVLSFAERDRIVRHYRHTFAPTESFFATAVANDPTLRRSGDYRRFTIWPSGALGPRVLRLDDLPAMHASGLDFARKFDPSVDTEILDALDEAIDRDP